MKLVSRMIVALTLVSGVASAQSSKAAWRFESVVGLSANTGGTKDTGWKPILTTHIKTPNGKELGIGVSLQCGLVTDTTVRSKAGDLDSSAARGKIAVRVRIVQPDGTTTYAMPSDGADIVFGAGDLPVALDGEGVTYCDRYQMLAAKFAGLNCTANLTSGAITCLDPEELQLILKTLDAHHFNFLFANTVPGVQEVVVEARAQAGMNLGGTQLGAAGAEAFIGAGALSVETLRFVKSADGTTDLNNLN